MKAHCYTCDDEVWVQSAVCPEGHINLEALVCEQGHNKMATEMVECTGCQSTDYGHVLPNGQICVTCEYISEVPARRCQRCKKETPHTVLPNYPESHALSGKNICTDCYFVAPRRRMVTRDATPSRRSARIAAQKKHAPLI